MPVEIRELHIKVVVNPPESAAPVAPGAPAAARGGEGGDGDREKLIAECVEQVMYLLREREER
jgi:hypothetical protein